MNTINTVDLVPSEPAAALSNLGLRLSPSSVEVLHKCPKLFYFDRVLNFSNEDIESQDAARHFHLDYGRAVEAGIIEFIKSGDLNAALMAAWLGYDDYEGKNKSLESLVAAVQTFAMQWPSDEWKLDQAQVGFKIDFEDAFGGYYCGYIDASVVNQFTGHIAPIECKTTGFGIDPIEVLYQNSQQAIAYPTVLSFIKQQPETTFNCMYVIVNVSKSWIPTIQFKPILKSKEQRLEWLLALKLDYENLKQYHEYNIWPQYGHSCVQYYKPCKFFGICHLTSFQEEQIKEQRPRQETFEHVIKFSELLQWVLDHD